MSKPELLELLKFLGQILFLVYLSFSIFITFLIVTNAMRLEYTDEKEHSKFEYIITLLSVIIFWPFYLIKSEISKGDK